MSLPDEVKAGRTNEAGKRQPVNISNMWTLIETEEEEQRQNISSCPKAAVVLLPFSTGSRHLKYCFRLHVKHRDKSLPFTLSKQATPVLRFQPDYNITYELLTLLYEAHSHSCELFTSLYEVRPHSCELFTSLYEVRPHSCELFTSLYEVRPHSCELLTSLYEVRPHSCEHCCELLTSLYMYEVQSYSCEMLTSLYEVRPRSSPRFPAPFRHTLPELATPLKGHLVLISEGALSYYLLRSTQLLSLKGHLVIIS